MNVTLPQTCLRHRSYAFLTRFYHRKHWESRSYRWTDSQLSDKERVDFVSYYNQSTIDIAAAKQSVHLTPESLLYTGRHPDGSQLMRSAQFLHHELPVRLAKRIIGFRYLPFIIGCNPTILSLHDMYIHSFKVVSQVPPIETAKDENEFSKKLRILLDDHSQVLHMLARGFKECQSRIKDKASIDNFLHRMLTSRLGMRLLIEHHLALRDERPNYIGIINKCMSLTKVIKKQAEIVSKLFSLNYGIAPETVIAGQTNLVFPYISMPLEYILTELFKNAFRATVESRSRGTLQLPPIYVTLASDDIDFWIKISDHAGGIDADKEDQIWDYHFSTPSMFDRVNELATSPTTYQPPDKLPPVPPSGGPLDSHIKVLENIDDGELKLPQPPAKTRNDAFNVDPEIFLNITHQLDMRISGYGFGLPTARTYARYLGGDLTAQTVRSIGSDFYLRLRHIDGKADSFRI